MRALAVAVASLAFAAAAQQPARPQPLLAGTAFQSPEARQMQLDDFANPGLLWVERGQRLWSEPRGAAGKS